MPTRRKTNPRPKRHTPELEEARAKRVLELLLVGWDGAILSNTTTTLDGDFRSRIRTSMFQTRRALTHGQTAHAALSEFIVPLFATTTRTLTAGRGWP